MCVNRYSTPGHVNYIQKLLWEGLSPGPESRQGHSAGYSLHRHHSCTFSFFGCQATVTVLFSPHIFSLFSQFLPSPVASSGSFYLSFGIFPWELNMLLSLFWNQLTSTESQSLVFQLQSPAGHHINPQIFCVKTKIYKSIAILQEDKEFLNHQWHTHC